LLHKIVIRSVSCKNYSFSPRSLHNINIANFLKYENSISIKILWTYNTVLNVLCFPLQVSFKQLFRLKEKKKTVKLPIFFALLGSAKAALIMLMKLTPGVNFINILPTAFAPADPESAKRYWRLDCLFYAFGLCGHKDVRRTLMKLSPDVKLQRLYKKVLDVVISHWLMSYGITGSYNYLCKM